MAHGLAAGSASGHSLITLDGRYHVVERIAAGGMGEVFRARDTVLARDVAIKVLHRTLAGDQGFVDRFRREARAAATLNHTNIVAVYDWGAVDGIYFMVMEHVRGRSVRDLLNAKGRLEPAQGAEIVRQTLLALEHAHAAGIVHRDLKPENMLVNASGVLKLTDLGLARAYAEARATQTGTVTGTVQYLAPEQIRGEPADPRTDLYSLGVVAFELLTGRLPFTGETAMTIAYKHLSDRVPAPSSVVAAIPSELDAFVASATEKDRELRPESAFEMRRDLESIARDLPTASSLAELVAQTELGAGAPEKAVVAPATRATTVTIPRVERRRRRGLRRFIATLAAIAGVVAALWGAWTYLIPHRVGVPDVRHMSVQAATIRLGDEGFRVRLGKAVYSLDVASGDVVSIRPAPGSALKNGSVVTITPSLGPRPVEVPAVRGKTVEQATQVLAASHLRVGETARRYSDSVPEGNVIATEPGEGLQAHEGDELVLIVSRGPPPIPIPGVQGLGVDAATKRLRGLGFVVRVRSEFSDTVPKDFVISQDPAPPSEQPKGSTVTIVTSRGPESFAVDSYLGLTLDEAVAAIRGAGLVPSVKSVPGGVSGRVVGQSPNPGQTVHAGDTITIFVA